MRMMRFIGFHSLWVRLAVLMFLTSLSLVILLIVFYHQTEKRLYNEFARQTTELSKAVQIGLEGSAGSLSDPMSLESYMEGLDPKGIKEVSVINSANRIIASTRQEDIGKWITRQRKELIFKADLGEPVTGEGQIFNVIVPVVANGKPAGYIHLKLNTEDFSVLLRLSAIRRIFAAMFVLSIGTAVAVLLARYYTRPIVAMASAAEQVAAGDLDQSLPIERSDEIGQLARSFNDMIVRLREDRQVRERLRTAEHLASAGQFARHIAHEIKNPLNFISLSIDHIGDTCRPPGREAAERSTPRCAISRGRSAESAGLPKAFSNMVDHSSCRSKTATLNESLARCWTWFRREQGAPASALSASRDRFHRSKQTTNSCAPACLMLSKTPSSRCRTAAPSRCPAHSMTTS